MYEVELKVRGALPEVRAALEGAGADDLGRVRQTDTYYDAPHRSFAETDEALRLRQESTDHDDEPTGLLTYKGPLIEAASKTREELETGVDDLAAAGDILEILGFEAIATVRKTRNRFRYRGFTVSLDTVQELGEFVEIETAVTDESAVADTREDAREALRELGLEPDDHLRTSYLELVLD